MNHFSTTDNTSLTPQACWRLLVEHRRIWISSTIACSVIALGYALFMTRNWEAVQGLVVRDEASSHSAKQPGKFADLYEMRTFQETILEVAKSRQVLACTLMAVAAQESNEMPTEPTSEEIEKLRKRMSMLPPNGAEFGKTEIFYLSVKDPNRERAIRLVSELCSQLGDRLGQLRAERSMGLISEVDKQVELASQSHEKENARLIAFETEVGSDLGELRLLHSASGGQSDLRQQAVEMEKEQRLTESRLRQAEELLVVLQTAKRDPDQLVAMPSSLLSFQPTLQRLKDGLVDAQLRASRLSGMKTSDHPHVKAAAESVASIREELHSELDVAIKGLEIEINLSRNRQEVLHNQLVSLQNRLGHLAELRAEYSSRIATVENSRAVLSQARKQMSEVRAKQVGALSALLVTPFDKAETGPYPVGIGRASVLAIGTFSGFVLGVGWLFLSVSSAPLGEEIPVEITQPEIVTKKEKEQKTPSEKVLAAVAASKLAAKFGKPAGDWCDFDPYSSKVPGTNFVSPLQYGTSTSHSTSNGLSS
ncbi:GumC family protein [Bythopirellula polymerisocia]|uniref:Chain length determinant protein n=1 Tax=Bythopirellula polymerisocia TaxID=2528003 RepID=A0A5C6CTU8_9BACT|nr:Wzz/FepE/Etk N-terminal domain-containing protein [Bythopirellula polymerisocia]TWU27295.1 Chain length determinant protein [Bythopirellula polymerisocia]